MAEKFFEDVIGEGLPNNIDANQWLLARFKVPQASCSVEQFAAFYLNLIKSQTDEYIKFNTSTCNTPRKMTMTGLNDSAGDAISQNNLNEHRVAGLTSNQRRSSAGSVNTSNDNRHKRQTSRELFAGQNENHRMLKLSDLRLITHDSPQFANRKSLDASTPVNSFSKGFKSIDGTPSTPQSFKKNSFDQSTPTFRNSSRNSFDLSSKNNSNRRNLSSPMCLGDFMNTSNASSSGKGSKKKNSSHNQSLQDKPKFNSSDFPSLGEEAKSQPKSVEAKPKKRVVPITISRKHTPEKTNFISSSFQSDNNLLNASTWEADEGVDILSQRRMLCDQRDAITKDFTAVAESPRNLQAMVKENLPAVLQSPGESRKPTVFDEAKVERKDVLLVMAKLYSFLLDMNLVSNILTEFSYLFNLLNTEHNPFEHLHDQNDGKSPIELASSLLKNLHNCIFFTGRILDNQKHNLALLDVKTINVLIDNKRIKELVSELYEHLRSIVQQKVQLEASVAMLSKTNSANISKVVYFQLEDDNRDNFPSEREFLSFKKQRDMFYAILESWELKHLDPAYDFSKDLAFKIRSLVTLMEHPINMAHLAKLFTAQLIISCNFDNSADYLQTVLPGFDLSKLSKLRQRMVAPSLFSTQYQFPGIQTFFRDFIGCCDQHMIFMEQLKISLINELMQINDSMEAFSITSGQEDEDKSLNAEYIVKAETLTTLRVLAKFIGYVMARPYTYDGYRNPLVDKKQSQIRNLLHPDFDVKRVVLRAIDGRKLLITIPWLVEYLIMLDYITLRLDYYRELFQLLHTVYMRVSSVNDGAALCVIPTSRFIVRVCLGWLFEHPDVPEEYNNFKGKDFELKALENPPKNDEFKASPFNPHLETILNAACPFLADFRVAVMPQRMTKTVSRTGRYRHITTKIQDKSSTQPSAVQVQDDKERLIEAILAAQSVSMRKIVDFTIDRVSSAVIKDFQVKHLIAIRKDAKAEIEKLVPSVKNEHELAKRMINVYQEHLKRLQSQWNEDLTKNCETRVEGAFEAFLPIETLSEVKKTLINITIERTSGKLNDWRITNLSTVDVFSKDVLAEAQKMKENINSSNRRTTSTIGIDLSSEIMPSNCFNYLQNMLHLANLHSDQLDVEQLTKCIEMLVEVLDKQVLPTNAYRNIGFYVLQLMLEIIANRPELVVKELLAGVYAMWRHEKLAEFITPETKTDDDSKNRRVKVENFIFSNVISPRLLLVMQGKHRRNFEALGSFLVDLVKEKFITADDINDQSLRLYKHDWSKQTLDDIAFLIDHVKESLPSTTSSEANLLMELVVDLARDMENF